jgi:hypothetical protein
MLVNACLPWIQSVLGAVIRLRERYDTCIFLWWYVARIKASDTCVSYQGKRSQGDMERLLLPV